MIYRKKCSPTLRRPCPRNHLPPVGPLPPVACQLAQAGGDSDIGGEGDAETLERCGKCNAKIKWCICNETKRLPGAAAPSSDGDGGDETEPPPQPDAEAAEGGATPDAADVVANDSSTSSDSSTAAGAKEEVKVDGDASSSTARSTGADFSVLQAEMASQRVGTALQASKAAAEAANEDEDEDLASSGFGEGFDPAEKATASQHAASDGEEESKEEGDAAAATLEDDAKTATGFEESAEMENETDTGQGEPTPDAAEDTTAAAAEATPAEKQSSAYDAAAGLDVPDGEEGGERDRLPSLRSNAAPKLGHTTLKRSVEPRKLVHSARVG